MMSSSSDSDLSDLEMLFMLSECDDSDNSDDSDELDDSDESDDSDDSDDSEAANSSSPMEAAHPVWVYKKSVNGTTTFDAQEFLLRFRLHKTQVESLLAEIYPHLAVTGRRNNGITPIQQLLLTLRFYALGSVVEFTSVSKSSAIQIIWDVSCAINQLYSKYIYVNNTTEDFYKIARFPHVLGVIDCTHFRIYNPRGDIPEVYKNQKGSYSINVQAVCDANLKFMNIESKWPGSTHDATIFANSVLKAQCEGNSFGNKWLLGDNAYPLKPYMLTPIQNPQSKSEKLYNESHKKTRDCMDRCFQLWKRRFPVLTQILPTSVLSSNAVIIATAILHNICIMKNIEDVPPETEISYEETIPVTDASEVSKNEELEQLLASHFNEVI